MTDAYTVQMLELARPLNEARGRALDAFATAETWLAQIYAWLMHPAPKRASMVSLDAIQLTAPKIRVVRAVALARLSADVAKKLDTALKKLNARTEVRIRLAHWVGAVWQSGGLPISSFDGEIEYRLVPPWFSAKNLDFDAQESVSVADIETFIASCASTSRALMEAAMAIQNEIGSFPPIPPGSMLDA